MRARARRRLRRRVRPSVRHSPEDAVTLRRAGAVAALGFAAVLPLVAQNQHRRARRAAPTASCSRPSDHRVHDRRSDVDVARRLARRPHDRLRPARRPLHAADRRRRGHAHHRRPVVREPADVVARRQDHRVPERSHAASRTCGSPTPTARNPRAVSKDGKTNDRPQIMASPAWTPDGQYLVVSKSRPPDPGTFWLYMYHRDGGTGVRVGAPPPPQPAPDAPGPATGAARQPHGRRRVARRPLHLLRAAHRHLHLQRALPAVADLPPRSRDRRRVAGDQRAGQRHAPGAVARRQVAGLRHAPQDADRRCASATSRPAPSAGWPTR